MEVSRCDGCGLLVDASRLVEYRVRHSTSTCEVCEACQQRLGPPVHETKVPVAHETAAPRVKRPYTRRK